MRIVDAFWERRNLGVKAFEVTLESGDSADLFEGLRADFVNAYVVVKVPSSFVDALWWLPRNGFFFVETMFHCHHTGGDFDLNSVQRRILESAVVRILTCDDAEPLLDEVRQGVFGSDRIALDPRFGARVANERYANWIEDELANGATIGLVEVNTQPVGFYALKILSDSNARLFLSGLFRRYQNSGLGFCTHFLGIRCGITQGAKKVYLAFSSNNRGAAGLHFQKGHRLDSIYHSFVNVPSGLLAPSCVSR